MSGVPVTFNHPRANLVYGMLLGIRRVVGAPTEPDHVPTSKDFNRVDKIDIPPPMGYAPPPTPTPAATTPATPSSTPSPSPSSASSSTAPVAHPVSYDFKFKDYAPMVFRHIREIFSIDRADYLVSLTPDYLVSERGSPGKSGSIFYFSYDERFLIKTISQEEALFLMSILPAYYQVWSLTAPLDNPSSY